MKKLFSYDYGIVSLRALVVGALFFDRMALNYLVPCVAKDLPLNNTQIGLLAVGITEEQVAFGYNREIVTELLRKDLGFLGVVCTDWDLVYANPTKPASAWGGEDLNPKERGKKILDVGVDMFGGKSCAGLIVELVNEGEVTEARINESVKWVLHDKFILGLFDAPPFRSN